MSDEAPGWDAIEAALASANPGHEPLHYGSVGLSGQGVGGISAFPRQDHWHLVTFGLSELYQKVSEDPSRSGWGFELTFRPVRPSGDLAPPAWALNLLRQLGDAVFATGRPYADGYRLDPGGPINGRDDSTLTALVFTIDPELPAIETPNGWLGFLQVVGITREELAEMQVSSTAAVLESLRAADPLLRTDPERGRES